MNQLTDKVMHDINLWLENEGSIIRVKKSSTDALKIGLVQEDFIDDTASIYPTNEFYRALEKFLHEECNIVDISFNNTKTSFWKF